MTEKIKEMVTHYKDNGERVDEVLFQEIMKVIDRSNSRQRKIESYMRMNNIMADNLNRCRNRSEELVAKINVTNQSWEVLRTGNNRLREALEKVSNHESNQVIKNGQWTLNDCGEIARQALEESK